MYWHADRDVCQEQLNKGATVLFQPCLNNTAVEMHLQHIQGLSALMAVIKKLLGRVSSVGKMVFYTLILSGE